MSENIEKHIGSRISGFREKRGLKQAELAELVEVTPETISRMERGSSIPSLKTLAKIGNALNVSIQDFFKDSEQTMKSGTRKDNEISKIQVLLQGKKVEDIRLGYKVLKTLFDGLSQGYRFIRK